MIYEYGEVDSTSERAFEALAAGTARDGDVHVATAQSAGRGRLGRRWVSVPGQGLYLSVVHLPGTGGGAVRPEAAGPAMTMAAGVALFDTVRALGLAGARLDWPNDLVTDRGKLAGILVESRGFDPAAPHYVIGIGLNVAQTDFPTELTEERAVTSLALEGLLIEPAEVLAALLPELAKRLAEVPRDPAGLAADFLAALELAGRPVVVQRAGGEARGRLLALDIAGGITVETAEGPVTTALPHVHAVAPTSL